jgi:hypothetical protein
MADRLSMYDTIFVAELNAVTPSRLPCGNCDQKVSVVVTHVVMGHAAGANQFEAVVPGLRRLDPRGWGAGLSIEAHRRYLILSRDKRDAKSAFESPESVVMLDPDEDTVADLELILRDRGLRVGQQVASVAATLSDPVRLRSYFLAGYVGELLHLGSEEETTPLVQAISTMGWALFSNTGNLGLLAQLQELEADPAFSIAARERFRESLIQLAAVALATMPAEDARIVASQFVPAIGSSPGGELALRSALHTLVQDSPHRLTTAQKERAQEWLRVLSPQ